MPKKNKFTHVLQGHFGYGWEDLAESPSSQEIKEFYKSYKSNIGGTFRRTKHKLQSH